MPALRPLYVRPLYVRRSVSALCLLYVRSGTNYSPAIADAIAPRSSRSAASSCACNQPVRMLLLSGWRGIAAVRVRERVGAARLGRSAA